MNEADNKVKMQIVEKIKASTNILVTVSKDPSVDELSAALGLTALLNKIDKHSTAIFSGAIPPAITFLDPDKVFENTADSLRDFIIALDKEKADHLRYKVEGDVVKIFITPYRTTITEKDLEFSQGDYNIELVLALGVENQEHLDTALAANGQILHDVSIATFSAGEQASQLGSMDWRDQNASSLCEMVANLSGSLKTDTVLLDKQISTALLTGIVSATDRFSNPHTSSSVMTMAAQLMAAGADQQLIAAKLQESHEINSLPSVSVDKIATAPDEPIVEQSTLPPDVLSISHEPEDIVEVASVEPETTTLPQPIVAEQPVIAEPPEYMTEEPALGAASSQIGSTEEPLLGGILNATSDQAAEDARKELDEMQNKTILSHSYLSGSDLGNVAPINSVGQAEDTKMVDIFADGPKSTVEPTPSVAAGLPLPPPLPDFSTLPPAAAIPEPIIPPAPTTTSGLPDFNAPYAAPAPETSTLPPEPDVNDPSKFQIPV